MCGCKKWISLLIENFVKWIFVRGSAGDQHIFGKLHSKRHILGILSSFCVKVCRRTGPINGQEHMDEFSIIIFDMCKKPIICSLTNPE